jgi:hypothetical protein
VLKNNLKLLLEDEKNDIEMINCMPTKTTIIRSPYPNVKLQVSIYRLIQKKKFKCSSNFISCPISISDISK